MEKEKSKNITFKTIATFFLLFILPLGSIYFLSKGKNFNKNVFQELADKVEVEDFEIENQNNISVSKDMLHGRVAVINFFDKNEEKAKEQAKQIGKVHGSFDDTEDVYFISFIPKDTSENLLDRSINLGIKDVKQWSISELDAAEWEDMRSDVFKIPNQENGIVLMDTSLNIRHYYEGYNDSLIGNLVLHISKVIPKQQRRGL